MNIEEIKKRVEASNPNKLNYDDGDVRDSQGHWIAEFKKDADGELFVHARKDILYLLSIIDKHEIQSEQFEQFKKERREMIELMVNDGLISADQYLEVMNRVIQGEG